MMDNELKELLRSVLKEELEPINNGLNDIEINVKDLNKDVKDIKTGQEKLKKISSRVLDNTLRKSLIMLMIKLRASIESKRVIMLFRKSIVFNALTLVS